MCVPWESNPQPLRCNRNALPLSHRNTGTHGVHKPYVLTRSDISISVYLAFPDGFKCTEHLHFQWETTNRAKHNCLGALYFKTAPDLIMIFLPVCFPVCFIILQKSWIKKNWHLRLAILIWLNCLNVKKNQLLVSFSVFCFCNQVCFVRMHDCNLRLLYSDSNALVWEMNLILQNKQNNNGYRPTSLSLSLSLSLYIYIYIHIYNSVNIIVLF